MTTDYSQVRQPDILEVIANLSSDAVFTPPKMANAVLDLLPGEVWTNPTLRWLDPGAKTGVFLREITKRLMVGLGDVIPDEQDRLRHILTKMVVAIATEELTGMMTRRSLYCSKDASSDASVVRLASADGNVWRKRVNHAFNDKGTCEECKGTRAELEIAGRDNKAYGFIHADGRAQIDKEMDMKFDVIVGNPPYQMSGGGGGTNDTPLYNIFVDEAIKLNPRFISMIVPSRWVAGGRGLDDFRAKMLGDKRVRHLVDYPNAAEVFPSVDIKSGVCYFLWDRDNPGPCSVSLIREGHLVGPTARALDEYDVLIRDERGIEILRKVLAKKGERFDELLTGDTPFGFASNFKSYARRAPKAGEVVIHASDLKGRHEGAIAKDVVNKNRHLIDCWKVLLPAAGPGNSGGHVLPDMVLGKPLVAGKRSVCTQTYIVCGPLPDKTAAESVESYLRTRFLRFLVSLRKISQHAFRSTYAWVPAQKWDRTWTDAQLYKKYGITLEEQDFIAAMVKEMPE